MDFFYGNVQNNKIIVTIEYHLRYNYTIHIIFGTWKKHHFDIFDLENHHWIEFRIRIDRIEPKKRARIKYLIKSFDWNNPDRGKRKIERGKKRETNKELYRWKQKGTQMMANTHGFEFYDDTWQLIPPDYGATEYE